jgi:hypothetical protein
MLHSLVLQREVTLGQQHTYCSTSGQQSLETAVSAISVYGIKRIGVTVPLENTGRRR